MWDSMAHLDRRQFLILSGGATCLAAASIACGSSTPSVIDDQDPEFTPLVWRHVNESPCRCSACIRREMIGEWQVPEPGTEFFAHLRVYYECRHHPAAQGG